MDNNGLAEHDPYRGMKGAETRSDFWSKIRGKNNARVDGTAALKDDLNDREKVAAKRVDNWGDLKEGAEGAKEAEENADGLYSGSGKEESDNDTKKGGFKGVFKKSGPATIIGIFMAVFGIGGAMFGAQTFQPFSLVAQFQEVYNSMHKAMSMRSNTFFRIQLGKRDVKSPYKLFGKDFSLSEKQIEKLKEQGIEYDADYEGRKVLKYTDNDGVEQIIDKDNFKQKYMTDSAFAQKYDAGSKTWRGQMSGWYGTTTRKFLSNNKLTRNMFEKYKEKLESEGLNVETATSEQKKKVVVDLIKEHIKAEGDLTLSKKSSTDQDEDPEELSVERGGISSDADVKAKIKKIADFTDTGANVLCGAFNLIGAVNLMVTADEALQVINMTTSLFEAVDKTKAGYGNESPIMVFADSLNEHKKTTNVTLEENEDGELEPVAVIRDRSAMESEAIAGLYSGTRVNPNDPSVASFNITSNLKKIANGWGLGVASFELCSIARAGTAILSLGTGGVIKKFQVAAGIGLSVLVDLLVPTVASSMMRDIVSDLAGEDFGNAIAWGALMYLGGTHRASGGSLATMKKFEEFAIAEQQVIAEDARYERNNLNPFDMTSKYTFMGNIVNKLMNYSHANTLMSTITTSGSVVSSSVASLTDTASAYRAFEKFMPGSLEEYSEVCPYLASIGAIGDSFCQPYIITDMDMAGMDPDEVLVKNQELGSFSSTSGENVTIDGSSDLAKYIRYCNNRQSAFGVADQNIANELASTGDVDLGNSTVNAAANTAIGMIPFVGDVIDIIQSTEQLAYRGYISGESCVAGNTISASASPNWNTAKYYQQFIEDQTLAESMGLIEKSAVTAYLEDYYKENPLDNSYEGILARYSGLTKDNVIALLDIIDYENYIASYDPSDRYVFGGGNTEEHVLDFNSENVMDSPVVIIGRIFYADVRNRNFVV